MATAKEEVVDITLEDRQLKKSVDVKGEVIVLCIHSALSHHSIYDHTLQ